MFGGAGFRMFDFGFINASKSEIPKKILHKFFFINYGLQFRVNCINSE
jgi:hypothetical protein